LRCDGSLGFGFPLYPPRIHPPFYKENSNILAVQGL
jgi:hypothetical protein